MSATQTQGNALHPPKLPKGALFLLYFVWVKYHFTLAVILSLLFTLKTCFKYSQYDITGTRKENVAEHLSCRADDPDSAAGECCLTGAGAICGEFRSGSWSTLSLQTNQHSLTSLSTSDATISFQ